MLRKRSMGLTVASLPLDPFISYHILIISRYSLDIMGRSLRSLVWLKLSLIWKDNRICYTLSSITINFILDDKMLRLQRAVHSVQQYVTHSIISYYFLNLNDNGAGKWRYFAIRVFFMCEVCVGLVHLPGPLSPQINKIVLFRPIWEVGFGYAKWLFNWEIVAFSGSWTCCACCEGVLCRKDGLLRRLGGCWFWIGGLV